MKMEKALEVFSAVKERSEHFKECGCRFPLWTITERDEEAIDMAIEGLKVDAVQGEWKFVDNEIFAGEYFCSICGKRAEVDLYGEWILSNYCPSCGARMVKGGDTE